MSRGHLALDALQEELEIACLDTLRGDPPGPATARRLERACREVLLRRGLGAARVEARSDRRGTFVRLLLPAEGDRVQQVVLQVG